MSQEIQIPVSKEFARHAHINPSSYQDLYQESVTNPEGFWAEQAGRIDWLKPWRQVKSTRFVKPIKIEWFLGAELNVCFNCVDRHAARDPDRVAIIWRPENPGSPPRKITFQELKDDVARMANVLKKMGVKKGDRVTIYLPMIPEAAVAMLACARIGAVHSVVFGGFAADAIAGRIEDGRCEYVITADGGVRGGKPLPLKEIVDTALSKTSLVRQVLVVRHSGNPIPMTPGRDIWWHEERAKVSADCPGEPMSSEDPLFLLYTSGSTNKPKGVLHTSGGYLVYAATTHQYIFDYKPGEIYWCAADVGWVTGHTYMIYGPLANGATTVMYEGLPTYPSASRIWEIVDELRVNILYTAPTLLRSLIALGDEHVLRTSRKSLRVLGSVGEPINPEVWLWYHRLPGASRCPIVDTYWQTETGGIIISPLPGATTLKPGSATRPFFGVQPVLLDEKGHEIHGAGQGVLAIKDSWPGQMRTVYGDHERFELTYFTAYPGYYFTGDGARRDADGDYWILGRVDDVINVSGHRIGTAEIESCLVSHAAVAEAAAVGFPHDIKGQGLYCYVTLKNSIKESDDLRHELLNHVRREIGAFARPDYIQFTPGLPKTRSGKILRRILRKIAENQFDNLGDVSTLADPTVVHHLIENRLNRPT